MSLARQAITDAGLAPVLDARLRGDLDACRRAAPLLEAADLLVLGALADAVRAAEVGDAVRVRPVEADDGRVEGGGAPRRDAAFGLDLLRRVAVARVTGPHGAKVSVDWGAVGMELAQVALGFGADELVGPITTKRGLPIAEGALGGTGKLSSRVPMATHKLREIAALVRQTGRSPRFIGPDGLEENAP